MRRRKRAASETTLPLVLLALEDRMLMAGALPGMELHAPAGAGGPFAFDRSQGSGVAPPAGAAVGPRPGNENIWQAAPITDAFNLHSNPNSTYKIFLDFDGHTTSGTAWNSAFTGGNPFTTPAYSWDSDRTTFSNAELQGIIDIWTEVAEDFAPWDVDVTTVDPGVEALRKTSPGDVDYGIRVVHGPDQMGTGAGGIAYIGSFDWDSDTPAFTFNGDQSPGDVQVTAITDSHEVGHTVGLLHDGTSSQGYYGGHGTGPTRWGPLMGAPFYVPLTQWSRDTYFDADNSEDDLTIIATQNGFGYRPDDYGDAIGDGTNGILSGSAPTYGIIERNTDSDYFDFFAASGPLTISVDSLGNGASNLDILAEIYDGSGNLIASSNPTGALSALFNLPSVAGGQYTLRVKGTGEGDPLATGYTNYGSLGNYQINGNVSNPLPITEISLDAESNLVIKDRKGGGKNDVLTIQADTANGRYIISDPNSGFAVVGIPSASRPDTNTVYVPFAAVTGPKIFFELKEGDDVATVDYSLGDFAKDFVVHGDAGNDKFLVIGGTVGAGTVGFTAPGLGRITIDLLPLDATPGLGFDFEKTETVGVLSALDQLDINISGGADALIEDDGKPGDGISLLSNPTGQWFSNVVFGPKYGKLFINGLGGASEQLTVAEIDGPLDADVVIDLKRGPLDRVDFIGPVTLAAGRDLEVISRTVTVSGGGLSTTGGGDIRFSLNTSLQLGANVSAAGGTVSVVTTSGDITQSAGTITAGTLLLDLKTGIGTLANPLNTAVGRIEAETITGGIFINNTGDLAVGGADAALTGVRITGPAGDIRLVTTGSASVTSADDTVRGPGNVTIIATAGNLATGGQTSLDAIVAETTGNVLLQAGNDLLLGDAAGFGKVRSVGGTLTAAAGRDLVLNSNGLLQIDGGAGTLTATAGRNLTMLVTALNGGPAIETFGGAINLSTGVGGTFTANSDGARAVYSGGGTTTVAADDMVITKAIDAAFGTVVLTQASGATLRRIDLGGSSANHLGLTSAELGRITAGQLRIGRLDNAGDIRFTGSITAPTGWNSLVLRTGGAVVDVTPTEQADLVVSNLMITATKGIGSANGLDVDADLLAAVNTNSGNLNIYDRAGGLVVGTLDTLAGVTNLGSGGGSVRAEGGTLLVTAAVSYANDFTLDAIGGNSPTNHLRLDANVTHRNNGAITLRAGDDVVQLSGTILTGGTVIVTADADNPTTSDGVRGGIAQIGGTLNANNALLQAHAAIDVTRPNNTIANLAGTITGPGATFAFDNVGDLTVRTINLVEGITSTDGDVNLRTTGLLTLDRPITVGGVHRAILDADAVKQLRFGPSVTAAGITIDTAGDVGSSLLSFIFDAGNLGLDIDSSAAAGSQYLEAAETATVTRLDAGTGTIFLKLGNFVLTSGDSLSDASTFDLADGVFIFLAANDETVGTITSAAGAGVILGDRILTIGTGANFTYSGELFGDLGGLTKVGTGTLTLNGLNTFDGTTRVNGGTLHLKSPLTGPVQVNSGGTLTGDSVISGTLTVENGGVLTPGSSGPATLTTGDLILKAGAALRIQFEGDLPAERSQLSVNGSLTLDGSITIFGTFAPPNVPGTNYVLIQNDANDGITGTFSGLPQASFVPINGTPALILYNHIGGGDTFGNDLALTINRPPTASAGGPYAGIEGDNILLDASGSSDPEQDAADLTYTWDLDGDGTFGETGSAAGNGDEVGVNPTFRSLGLDGVSSRSIGLRVTDNSGDVATASATLDLGNKAPTATITQNGPVNEGAGAGTVVTVALTNPLDPSDLDVSTGFHYSFATSVNGLATSYASAGTGSSADLSFDDDGVYTIFARIFDKDDGASDYQADVTVANVAPTATFGNDGPVLEGTGAGSIATVALTGAFDPSTADTAAGFHYSIALTQAGLAADYASATDGSTAPFSFDDNGTYRVFARIFDKDGDFSEYFTDVVVNNAKPTATISNGAAGIEATSGAQVSLVNPQDRSGADTTATFRYTFGVAADQLAGSYTAARAASSASFVFDDEGIYTIFARIFDKDDGFTDYRTDVVVNGVKPTAEFEHVGSVFEGRTVPVRFTNQTDPSSADRNQGFRYSYDFDNNGTFDLGTGTFAGSVTSAEVEVPASFVKNGPGTQIVRAWIIDKDGLHTEYTTTLNVLNVAPTARFAGSAATREGVQASFSFTNIADFADDLPGLKYSYDFDGDGIFDLVDSTSSSATKAYFRAGTYNVVGRIKDADGDYTDYTTSQTITPSALTPLPRTFTAVAGKTYTGGVASFIDGSPGSLAGQYRATINWGDGIVTTGKVIANGGGKFSVIDAGNHTYRVGGTYRPLVTLVDSIDGSRGSALSTANITDAPITPLGRNLTAPTGILSNVTIGSFTDSNLRTLATDFKVSVSWGDGTSSAVGSGSDVTIRKTNTNTFAIIGSHTYRVPGVYRVTITITGKGGTITQFVTTITYPESGRRA